MESKTGLKVSGVVISGWGEEKGFLEIPWVREQCRRVAGFTPYSGTLNLKVDGNTFSRIKRLAMNRGKRIIPPADANGFFEARLLPLSIGGLDAALIYPMLNDYFSDTLELIASFPFTDKVEIGDGAVLEALLMPHPIPSRPAAVIFDLDGTLVDSVDFYYSILNEGCRRLQVKPPAKETFIDFAGRGLGFWEVWAVITGSMPLARDQEGFKKRISAIFEDIWQQRYEKEVGPFAGVRELLLLLQEQEIKIGVVTSSFYVKKMDLFKWAGLEPEKLFASLITGNDVARIKPHPEPIFRCLEQLGVPAQRCFYIGDSPCDIAAGRAAGLFTVGVLTGTGTVQSLSVEGADAILERATDLPELLE